MAALWLAWLAVNAATFTLYGVDKRRARRGEWRISERMLLTATWLMGGVGAYLGMRKFRHKTKHAVFRYSVPTAAILQLILMAMLTIQQI